MFYAFNFRKIRKAVIAVIVVIAVSWGIYSAVKIVYPLKYLSYINQFSIKYDLEPSFVCAVIHAESRFDHKALSNKGASGLMQLMKQTADWGAEEIGLENYNYDNVFSPAINIELGCWYLARLIKQYEGNEQTALAAYNAGSGNVSKWLKNKEYSLDGIALIKIPFNETAEYVKKIERNTKLYKFILRLTGGTYD